MDRGVFVSRVEAESTTLRELLERYLEEVTPLKKGAASESARIRAFLRHPLTQRIVASIRSFDASISLATVMSASRRFCRLLSRVIS